MGRGGVVKDFLDKYNVSFKTSTQRRDLVKRKDFRNMLVALAKEHPQEFSATVKQVHSEHQKALFQSFKNKGPETEPRETRARQSSPFVYPNETEEEDREHENRLRFKVEQASERNGPLNGHGPFSDEDFQNQNRPSPRPETQSENIEDTVMMDEVLGEEMQPLAAEDLESAGADDCQIGGEALGPPSAEPAAAEGTRTGAEALSGSSPEPEDNIGDIVSEQETKYDIEIQLLRGELPDPLRQRCLSVPGETNQRDEHKEKSLAKIQDKLARFDPEVVREYLMDFLEKRLEQPGLSELPEICKLTNPGDLFHALDLHEAHAEDSKIHEAFGHVQLYLSVKIEAEKREGRGTVLAGRKSMHIHVLEEMALERAGGPVTEKKAARIRKACQKRYIGGLNWLHLIKCFGGQGIVFLFVMAGINPGGWTEYQRQCLRLIARELHEVKRMVGVFDAECLSDYCEKGFIPKPVVDRLKALDLYPDCGRIESDEATSTDLLAVQKRISNTSETD